MRYLALLSALTLAACVVQPGTNTGASGTTGTTGASGASGTSGQPQSNQPDTSDPLKFDPFAGDAHSLFNATFMHTKTSLASSEYTGINVGLTANTEETPAAYSLNAATKCGEEIKGCIVTKTPKCSTTCKAGEYCAYDKDCDAVCVKPPATPAACKTKTCAPDTERCVVENSKEVCKPVENFDAGKVKFTGLPAALTLTFPYEGKSSSTDALFDGEEEVTIKAFGSTEDAGFDAFEEKFKLGANLVTQLKKLKSADVVTGTKDVTVTWTKGSGVVYVSGSSNNSSFVCNAKDADGTFTVSRDVLDEVLPAKGSFILQLGVVRYTMAVKKGMKLKGELTETELPKEGWLVFTHMTMDSVGFTGGTGPTGTTGTTGTTGGSGPSQACIDCVNGAKTGACKTEYDACVAVTTCKALLDCALACPLDSSGTSCISGCYTSHPDPSGKSSDAITCAYTECSGTCQ